MDPKAVEKPPSATSSFKGPIYTTGDYWGGHVLPYWVWLLFAILPFTGFFGLDHLLFRSPSTALFKGFTNIFTLGLWYFYDIVQGLGDRDYIKEYGLTTPFAGPKGLAYGYFSGIKGGDTKPQSSVGFAEVFRFVIFCFTVYLPFGISNFIAGDSNGGILKIFATFIPLFIIIAGVFESYRLLMTPQDLYEKGASRFFLDRMTSRIDPYGVSSALMTPKAYEAAASAAEKANQGFIQNTLDWIKQLFGVVKQLPAVGSVVQGAEVAADGAGSALEGVGKSARQLGKTVSAALNTAGGLVETASTVAPVAAAALIKGPQVLASAATEKLATATASAVPTLPTVPAIPSVPAIPKKNMNSNPTPVQQGGAVAEKPQAWDGLVMGGIGLLAFGGIASSLFQNAFRDPYGPAAARMERNNDDTPPRPGVL